LTLLTLTLPLPQAERLQRARLELATERELRAEAEKRAATALKELQRRREGGARRARRGNGNGNAPLGSAGGRGRTGPGGSEPTGLDLEPFVPEERAVDHRPTRPASADPKKRTAAAAAAAAATAAAAAAAPAAAALEGWGDGLGLSEEERRAVPCNMHRTVHMHHAPCTMRHAPDNAPEAGYRLDTCTIHAQESQGDSGDDEAARGDPAAAPAAATALEAKEDERLAAQFQEDMQECGRSGRRRRRCRRRRAAIMCDLRRVRPESPRRVQLLRPRKKKRRRCAPRG